MASCVTAAISDTLRGVRPKDPCPCRSSASYADCCLPAHDGTKPPAAPRELVRARYSAFALGLGEFLHATLSSDHEDHADGDDVPRRVRELSTAGKGLKYMGVDVLASTDTEALFVAKVFEKGKDRGFAELSRFAWEDGTLRYVGGLLLPKAALPNAIATMPIDAFRAYAEAHPDLVVGG